MITLGHIVYSNLVWETGYSDYMGQFMIYLKLISDIFYKRLTAQQGLYYNMKWLRK